MNYFSLKIFSNGLTYKYRFSHAKDLQKALADAIRKHGYINRAWCRCPCHNIEEEIKCTPLGRPENLKIISKS